MEYFHSLVTLGKKVTIQQMELVKRVKIWYSIKNQWFYLLHHWRTQKNKQLFGFLIMNIQAIEQEVLHLPIEDRARLAEKLLSSLDALSEQEVEKLWFAEAQRRASEIDNGTVQLVSSEEMERRILAIL